MSFLHLFPLLLLQFSSPFLISSAYTPPDKYFLNCGSDSDVNFGLNRRFIGDAKPRPWPISPGKSKRVKDDTISKTIPEIYHTARVYNEPTWYVFNGINQNGTYVVRLHFFPHQNLPQARFNVSASSGFLLLSNFSVHNSGAKTPIVEEFAFELQNGSFGIQFSPLQSALAFVNAIELFLAPDEFKPQSAYALSAQVRFNGSQYSMLSEAFHTSYRVSVGGSLITPDNDTLWRTWLPDDKFLAFPSSAKTISYGGNIVYKEVTTGYTAPTYVYSTAKELKMDATGRSRLSNLTWVFKVKKNTKYFVQLHFCDIITEQRGTTFRFDYFLGSNRTFMDSSENTDINAFAKPFRQEFAVVTDNSGFFNTGVARNDDAPLSRAFLNGIEIRELVEKSFVGAIVETAEEKGRNHLKGVIVGVCVGGGVVILGVVMGLVLCYFRVGKSKKSRPLLVPQNDPSEKIVSIEDLAPNLNLELKISFGEISAATDGFDKDRTIGVGGFGKVYYGRLGDKEVAVKRSRPGFGQGLKEFQTEVIILSEIRHRHLVSLYGYCDEGEEMILVYEYMEGGTLREYLYGSKARNNPPLSWKQRLEICIDAAKGLDYLHTGSTAGVIIHRDIKTTNILLDKNSMAKVADFGISKSGVPDAKELDTTIRGTYGYLDPEYFNTGQLTEKSDVYSFGVVLLEALSGRAPIVESLPSEEINLADWAILCKSRGEVEKLIDPFLVGTIEANSLRKFVEVAQMCVDEVGAKRPSMHDVVYDLELSLQFQLTPTGGGKGFDGSTTIVDAQWEIPSMAMGDIDDSVMMMMDEDSTTVNARELVAQFKIECAR